MSVAIKKSGNTNDLQYIAGCVGGITSDDILSLEEITASTQSEDALNTLIASAQAVKDLNSNLSNVNVYVGSSDSKLHFVDSTGADTVLNFSSSNGIFIIFDSMQQYFTKASMYTNNTGSALTFNYCINAYEPGNYYDQNAYDIILYANDTTLLTRTDSGKITGSVSLPAGQTLYWTCQHRTTGYNYVVGYLTTRDISSSAYSLCNKS